jgi:RHS repeat-associated protein
MTQTRRLHSLFLILTAVLLSGICFGQAPTSGPQPFGSFAGGPFDSVNLGNLNVSFTVPIVHKAGRGLPFTYDLSYANSIWSPVLVSGTTSWTPAANLGWLSNWAGATGYMTFGAFTTYCYDNMGHQTGVHYFYSGFNYHDPLGRTTGFSGTTEIYGGSCSGTNVSLTAQAQDGSGYILNAQGSTGTITDSNGVTTSPPMVVPPGPLPSTKTDSNGNQITSSGSVFTDTLGTTALTITGSNPVSFAYTSPSGSSAAYLMHYTAKTVKTAFGCSGVAEYGPTSASLVSDITLPDGSQYLFTYEPTPGFPGDVTGRLQSVTLPTGGTITYAYTGGNHGITCSDGTTAGLTRQLSPGGTWTYTRSNVSGSQWRTTVTDPTTPTGNQTVIDFQKDSATGSPTNNFFETQRLVYQGNTSGTLLHTSITCYNTANPTPSSCTTTAVATPISRRVTFNYLPDSSGLQAETDEQFLAGSTIHTQVDSYDYGSAAVGPLISSRVATYGVVYGTPPFLVSIEMNDGAGTTKSSTAYTWDEGSVTTTSGTPNHVSVSASRNNLTTLATKINATQTLYRKFTYYDTGTLNASTDVSLSSTTNGPSTTYVYGAGSCGNSFPTQVNLPLSLSRSMTWNCTGGVELSATDENGKTVSATYNDANFWRPAQETDQLLNNASIVYPSATASEVALAFNAGHSTVDSRAKTDGFGRLIIRQSVQQPGGSTYDSVETDYDVIGRVAKAMLPYAATVDSLCTGTCPGTTFAYDGLSRPTLVTDGGGGTATISYPQNKNDVLSIIGPAPTGEATKNKQLEHDAMGRLTSVCEITSATGSGACGQSLSQTGFLTKYTYDPLDNVTGVTQNAQPGSSGAQTRAYAFDMLSRMTSETNPETGLIAYVYDTDATCGSSAGDLVKRTDAASNVTCYTYDQLHRRLSVTYPTGTYAASTPKKYFVYDSATVNSATMSNAKGRLAEAYTCTTACPGTKITDLGFSYSARGEVTDVYESTLHSGGYYHTSGAYWPHGALNALSGIPGVPTVYYGASDGSGLDGEGRYTKVTVSGTSQTPVTGVIYTNSGTAQPIGSLTQVTFGSLDTDNFSYSTNTGRLAQYQFKMGTTPQTDTGALTWNANGTLGILAVTDQINSAENQSCSFTYDDLGRLASKIPTTANIACGTAWNQTISLDPFGNISKSATVGTSFQATYAPTTNRLTQIGSSVPTYDANGNLTNDTFHAYSWDAEGKMLSADGSTVVATYDAFGRMMEQTRGSNYTQILYGPGGRKLAMMNGQTLQKAFVQLPAGATAVYNSSGLAYYRHSDGLGSSRLATTPTRTKYYDVAYAPYGESYDGSGTTSDVSFTGQNPDTVSWLYDFMFREYNPVQGRWMSPDPIGLAAVNIISPQTWDRYAYVENNPLAYIDPDGTTCDYDVCVVGDGIQVGTFSGQIQFETLFQQLNPANNGPTATIGPPSQQYKPAPTGLKKYLTQYVPCAIGEGINQFWGDDGKAAATVLANIAPLAPANLLKGGPWLYVGLAGVYDSSKALSVRKTCTQSVYGGG